MRSTRSHSGSSTRSSSSSSEHSTSSTLFDTAIFLDEKSSRTYSRPASFLLSAKKRAIYATIAAVTIGFLIANVIFRLSLTHRPKAVYDSFQHYLSDQLRSQRSVGPTNAAILSGDRPTVIALVSFESRSRTELLDCYLQQNLISNGGLLDRVVFSPDTQNGVDLAWLRNTVSNVEGYNLLITNSTEEQLYTGPRDKLFPFYDTHGATGTLAKPWVFANALARKIGKPEGQPEPLFLFINSETIYISPSMIASMIYTQQTQPEHSIIQANVVNQQTLSWIHGRLGALKTYRPEYMTVVSDVDPAEDQQMDEDITKSVRREVAAEHTTTSARSPWRASELPLWVEDEFSVGYPSAEDTDSSPSLFGIPIDLKPPPEKTRWLPFDPRVKENPNATKVDFRHRPSISNLLTQKALVMNGPGQWPWTIATQQLYSFLEHLEEEQELEHIYVGDTHEAALPSRFGRSRGLARYRFPLWSCEAETVELSLFLISSSDLIDLSAFPNLFPPNANGLDVGKWSLRKDVTNALGARTPVIDGNAVAARYLQTPGNPWSDSVNEAAKGLDSTDLLERFAAYGREVGCKIEV